MKTPISKGDKKSKMHERSRPVTEPVGSPAVRLEVVYPLAVFVVALILRLIYLFQIETMPLFYYLGGDARAYDEWARQIVGGDWLGKGVFYQAPLYPYFLALLQWLFGHDLWSIRVVQAVLGAFSCSLLYWVGNSFFSRGVGVAAALILALYGPAIFYGGLIQKAVLGLFLTTLLLVFLAKARTRPRSPWWAAVGVALALLGLTRENALIWLMVVPVWIWFSFSDRAPRIRLRWLGISLLGSALVLLPVGLRNYLVGGDFTLTTSQLGPNFYIGNGPNADGTYVPLRVGRGNPQFERQDATELAEKALGRNLSPGEVSSYWLEQSWKYIRSQPSAWLRLMGKKSLMVWNVREIEDYDDFYLYQHWSWLLSALGWASHFGILAPLAVMGFVLTWGQRRRLWLLYVLIATLAFSVTLFYVFGRYRFPLVPFLCLFAGAGIVEGFTAFRCGRVREALAASAMLLATVALTYWPVAGWPGPSASGYLNLGSSLAKQGNNDQAIAYFHKALELDSNFAEAHYDLGIVLTIRAELEEAILHLRKALDIDPTYAKAHCALGIALASRGRVQEAIDHFREALRIEPRFAECHESLGQALALQGKREEAIRHFEEAVRILRSRSQSGVAELGRMD